MDYTNKKYIELDSIERDCTTMVIEGGVPVVLLEDIKELETVEMDIKEGIWIPINIYSPTWGTTIIHHYECSNCNNVEYVNGKKYCSNCGAKMRRDIDQCHSK